MLAARGADQPLEALRIHLSPFSALYHDQGRCKLSVGGQGGFQRVTDEEEGTLCVLGPPYFVVLYPRTCPNNGVIITDEQFESI